jgi:BirA family biotin operon repressor/biotin-[acetyl-CoA-carboxylase] ligase
VSAASGPERIGPPATDDRRALLDALAAGPADPGVHGRETVATLRATGVGIERRREGYVLTGRPPYGAAAIALGLDAPYAVEFHDRIESTNDRAAAVARDAAGADAGAGVAVFAGVQTGGRGRRGRSWTAPPGGLYCSLALRPSAAPARTPRYALAGAVAAARACERVGVETRIKWPNDVLAAEGGGKLAGVLAESGEGWLALGVGLNADVNVDHLPDRATSLRALAGGRIDRAALARALLEAWFELTGTAAGRDRILPAWRERAGTLGRRVRVETPSGTVVGRAVDVVDPGALVVATGDGRTRIDAGDCEHLRPD